MHKRLTESWEHKRVSNRSQILTPTLERLAISPRVNGIRNPSSVQITWSGSGLGSESGSGLGSGAQWESKPQEWTMTVCGVVLTYFAWLRLMPCGLSSGGCGDELAIGTDSRDRACFCQEVRPWCWGWASWCWIAERTWFGLVRVRVGVCPSVCAFWSRGTVLVLRAGLGWVLDCGVGQVG